MMLNNPTIADQLNRSSSEKSSETDIINCFKVYLDFSLVPSHLDETKAIIGTDVSVLVASSDKKRSDSSVRNVLVPPPPFMERPCNYVFPETLFNMLNDILFNRPEFSHVVSWMPHGRSFKVHDMPSFEKILMPIYFPQQKKYSSFSRQLNLWRFRRVNAKGPDKGCYFHSLFLRGMTHLVRRMRRKAKVGLKIAKEDEKKIEPNFYALEELRPLPAETCERNVTTDHGCELSANLDLKPEKQPSDTKINSVFDDVNPNHFDNYLHQLFIEEKNEESEWQRNHRMDESYHEDIFSESKHKPPNECASSSNISSFFSRVDEESHLPDVDQILRRASLSSIGTPYERSSLRESYSYGREQGYLNLLQDEGENKPEVMIPPSSRHFVRRRPNIAADYSRMHLDNYDGKPER